MGISQPQAAIIFGAGENLGSAVARRFAEGGYHVVASRRRGDLSVLKARIDSDGGLCTTIHADAREEDQVIALFDRVEAEIGPIGVVVFNVGGNVRYHLLETTARVYRKTWEMCAYAGFLVVREATRRMLPRREGTILLTGATASIRGASGFAAFAGGKHALRALAQCTARELNPQGIHVAHVVIDGPIESSATRTLFPDLFETRPAEAILQPSDIAEIYWQLHCQPRSAWSFEIDVRTNLEPW